MTVRSSLQRISRVEFRVRDLAESARFYGEVLMLTPRADAYALAGECAWGPADDAASDAFGVVLVEGLPPGAAPFGLDHVSFEVASRGDVERMYARAQEHLVRVTTPRSTAGRYRTFLFDPDGYKIEVFARDESVSADVGDSAGRRADRD